MTMQTQYIASQRALRHTVSRFPAERHYRWFTVAYGVLLLGYAMFDRAFAWIHVPGTPAFLGEIALVVGLFLIIQTPELGRLLRLSRPMQFVSLFMLLGLYLLAQGFADWGIDAVRDSAIWYYGFFAVIAGVLLLRDPELFDQAGNWIVKLMPVVVGVLFFRLALANSPVGFSIPDSPVTMTAHKSGNMAVIAAIFLTYLLLVRGRGETKRLRDRHMVYTLLALLLIAAAGTQSRSGLLSAGLILGVVFLYRRHARRTILWVMAAVLLLIALAAALDVRVQLQRRELSVAQVLDNVTSAFTESQEGRVEDNTTQWRLGLWSDILDEVNEPDRILTGFGFGENLAARLHFSNPNSDAPLRNPHNSHLSVIARMGGIGIGLWVALFWVWYAHLWRARRYYAAVGDGKRADLSLWVMLGLTAILVNAVFDPTLEGPQVGIPAWTLFGVGAVLALQGRGSRPARSARLLHEEVALPNLRPELRDVMARFDELLGDTPQSGSDYPGDGSATDTS